MNPTKSENQEILDRNYYASIDNDGQFQNELAK